MGSITCIRCGGTAHTTDKNTLFDWIDREGYYCNACGLVWFEMKGGALPRPEVEKP